MSPGESTPLPNMGESNCCPSGTCHQLAQTDWDRCHLENIWLENCVLWARNIKKKFILNQEMLVKRIMGEILVIKSQGPWTDQLGLLSLPSVLEERTWGFGGCCSKYMNTSESMCAQLNHLSVTIKRLPSKTEAQLYKDVFWYTYRDKTGPRPHKPNSHYSVFFQNGPQTVCSSKILAVCMWTREEARGHFPSAILFAFGDGLSHLCGACQWE